MMTAKSATAAELAGFNRLMSNIGLAIATLAALGALPRLTKAGGIALFVTDLASQVWTVALLFVAAGPARTLAGGVPEHAEAPPAVNTSDPFASPQATPGPLYSDGPQVDGPTSPGDDSAETDYINPNGTPLGSAPATTQASGVNPQTAIPTRGVPHKPYKP